MTRLLPAFAALLLAGCAAQPRPYQAVAHPVYSAIGRNPLWTLAIGDDRIVFRTAEGGEAVFPRTLPTSDGNVGQWRSANGADSIVVDTRQTPTPCENGRQAFEDFVLVTVGERRYEGCGGRLTARDQP